MTLCLLTVLIVVTACFESFADTAISYVRLELNYDVYVENYDLSGVEIVSYQDGYETEFSLPQANDSYKAGDELRIDVVLTADDGFTFTDIKKGSCKMDDVVADELMVSQDGKKVSLVFKMPAVTISLRKPVNLKLSKEGMASWDEVNNADSYNVVVQKMNDMGVREYVESRETGENSCSLFDIMYAMPGDYLFTVEAKSRKYYFLTSETAELPLSDSVETTMDDIGHLPNMIDDFGRARYDYDVFAADEMLKIGGLWYYFGKDNLRKSGFVKVNGKYYYFSPDTYERQVGIVKTGGKTYYMDPVSAELVTGFVSVDGKEKFFSSNGAAKTGWVSYKGKKYFINPDGSRNYKQLIDKDNRTYLFDKEGALIENAVYKNR